MNICHLCLGFHRGQKRALDSLELELVEPAGVGIRHRPYSRQQALLTAELFLQLKRVFHYRPKSVLSERRREWILIDNG